MKIEYEVIYGREQGICSSGYRSLRIANARGKKCEQATGVSHRIRKIQQVEVICTNGRKMTFTKEMSPYSNWYIHRVTDGREYRFVTGLGDSAPNFALFQRDPETQAGWHPSILSVGIVRFACGMTVDLMGVAA